MDREEKASTGGAVGGRKATAPADAGQANGRRSAAGGDKKKRRPEDPPEALERMAAELIALLPDSLHHVSPRRLCPVLRRWWATGWTAGDLYRHVPALRLKRYRPSAPAAWLGWELNNAPPGIEWIYSPPLARLYQLDQARDGADVGEDCPHGMPGGRQIILRAVAKYGRAAMRCPLCRTEAPAD